MASDEFVPLETWHDLSESEQRARAAAFRDELSRRRSVRQFSPRPIPDGVLRDCLEAAGAAPSGANRQPWRFVVVRDAAARRRLREAVEREERAFYERRAPDAWLDALAPLGTDADKPYFETAPCTIAIFARHHEVDSDGSRAPNYYVRESVGIATGFLIAALHHAGLATLTQTPSRMGFLNDLLERPANERPFLLLVTGYPAPDARVPDLERRPLDEIATFV